MAGGDDGKPSLHIPVMLGLDVMAEKVSGDALVGRETFPDQRCVIGMRTS
jgi:hypothetical protein